MDLREMKAELEALERRAITAQARIDSLQAGIQRAEDALLELGIEPDNVSSELAALERDLGLALTACREGIEALERELSNG